MKTMQKIATTLVSMAILLITVAIPQSHAQSATDPVTNFSIECNSSTKPLLVGFTSDPSQPNDGPLIIAGSYQLHVAPITPSLIDDLADITLTPNEPQYTNLFMAENTKVKQGNTYVFNITFGFTGQQAINTAEDLFFINVPAGQNAKVTVESAELFGLNDVSNLYVPHDPKENFMYNAQDCTAILANENNNSSENTEENQTPDTPPQILITAPASQERGAVVNISAQMQDVSSMSVQWVQTAGPATQPTIEDDTEFLTSELSFTMPDDTPNDTVFTFEITVTNNDNGQTATDEATVSVRGELAGTAGALPNAGSLNTLNNNATASLVDQPASSAATSSTTTTSDTTTTATQTTTTGATAAATTNNNQVTPTTIHGTQNLVNSGPKETALIILVSILLLVGYKRLRKSR
jgi:hypothetical protein